ncbi:MAG: nitrilase-related carbon-nitrogen hydrolase [Ilumatobacteraceae bacterium]
MKIACIQHDIVWEDKAANFERLAPMIAGAAASGARVVLLTETFSTGFSMQTERTAESPGGPSSEFLLDQATRHGIWVGGSYPEITEDSHEQRPFNTFALAGPSGSLTKYRKVHPFSYGKEHEHFSAGDTLCTVEIDGLRVALFVCYDPARGRVLATGTGGRRLLRGGELAGGAPAALAVAAPGPGDREPGLRRGVQPGRFGRQARLRR